MSKRLIVNADGFGFTPGLNRGIREAIERGIVTSVSCNANFPYIDELPALANDFPRVSLGVHLNLSVGRPVLPPADIPSLVDETGCLFGNRFAQRVMTGRIRSSDMRKELDAQIQRMLDLGVKPSHWDGHQNKHLFPPFFFAALQVAKKHGIMRLRTHRRYLFLQDGSSRWKRLGLYYAFHPSRLMTHLGGRVMNRIARLNGFRTADRLITPGYADDGGKFLLATWQAIMQRLPEGANEIYCHPGYPDDILRAHAHYVDERKAEIDVLTSDDIRAAVRDNNIELISFFDI